MARYKYFTGNGKCIVVSSYAGKPIRGVAKVAPNDEFNLEKGIALAKARCDKKVAEKRLKRAELKLDDACELLSYVKEYFEKAGDYYSDAADQFVEASNQLNDILKNM